MNVTLQKRGGERLRRGYVWVFRSDVASAEGAVPGQIVRMQDAGGNFMGYAYFGGSELSLRLLTREDTVPDRAFFKRQLQAAIDRRARTSGSMIAAAASRRRRCSSSERRASIDQSCAASSSVAVASRSRSATAAPDADVVSRVDMPQAYPDRQASPGVRP